MSTEEQDREQFHPVVRLLLGRMETNPEDFSKADKAWVQAYQMVRSYGKKVEIAAVEKSYNRLMLDKAHNDLMRALLDPEEESRIAELELRRQQQQLQAQIALLNTQQACANTQAQNLAGMSITGPAPQHSPTTGILGKLGSWGVAPWR